MKKWPRFHSEEPEAACGSKHSPSDYAGQFRPAKLRFSAKLRKRLISIRMDEQLLRDVKRIAIKKHVPYQTYIHSLLVEKVRAELHRAA